MRVKDVMNKRLITVVPDTLVSEVLRIIFNLGISGVPVVSEKKLVGIITKEDLLKKAFPSVKDYMEDWMKASSFESFKDNLSRFIYSPVKKIMSVKITTIDPEVPITHAQSLLVLNRFSRLPVVDSKGNLLGMLSQGDIFKSLVKDELPKIENAKYATFVGQKYDEMVNWKKRLAFEFPTLLALFERKKVKKLLSLGCWTGEYAIAMAKKNIDVVAVDNNPLMIQISNEKKKKLPQKIKSNIEFVLTEYQEINKNIKDKFDAVYCSGNALPYIDLPLEKLFFNVKELLRNKGIFIIQLLNFEKILKQKNRLLSFKIHESENSNKESMSVEFIRSVTDDHVKHNVALFDYDGKDWYFSGMTTVKVKNLDQKKIESALKKVGFSKLSFAGNMGEYQGDYGPLSFKDPFYPLESDWLNVVAEK